MKRKNLLTICVFSLLAFAFVENANAIGTPGIDACAGGDCLNLGPFAGNDDASGVSGILGLTVTEIFKSDPPGTDGNGITVTCDPSCVSYSGTWSSLVPIAYVTVKAGNYFLIQNYALGSGGPATNGLWSTFGLTVGQEENQPVVSHVSFFNPGDTPGGQIPEPSTMLLLGTGLAGLAAWRYRKRVKV